MAEKRVHFTSIKDVPDASWKKLSQKRIYFGHQSVGNNIMAGINDLIKENSNIRLNIVETKSPSEFNSPLFAHSPVGKNVDPRSKIDDFVSLMEKGIAKKADICFFKFCYIDIDDNTDYKKLFDNYEGSMTRLKKDYPKKTFVHVTIPLMIKTKTSLLGLIKKLLWKKKGFFDNDHNVARNEFNDLLRKEYEGKEPIFDLAKVESTHPDGKRETFTKRNKTYPSLVPEYASDGRHLNETGRKRVAEQLLILLAGL